MYSNIIIWPMSMLQLNKQWTLLNNARYYVFIKTYLRFETNTRSLRADTESGMVKDLGARVWTNPETFGQYSLTFLAPSVWNSLPAELKSAPLQAHFRSLIKIHLFRPAFGRSAYVLYVLVCFSMCGYVNCVAFGLVLSPLYCMFWFVFRCVVT